MEKVEGRVGSQSLDVANRIADAFSQRLVQTEAALQRLQEETERHWSSDGERQIALETSVRAHLQGAEDAAKKHERDLGEIYQALVKLGANQQTLGDNFTAWRIETGGDIGIVSNRLQQLEQTTLDLLSCWPPRQRHAGAAPGEPKVRGGRPTASSAGCTAPATSWRTLPPPADTPSAGKSCHAARCREEVLNWHAGAGSSLLEARAS